jgi:hypothetical protein
MPESSSAWPSRQRILLWKAEKARETTSVTPANAGVQRSPQADDLQMERSPTRKLMTQLGVFLWLKLIANR